METISSPHWTTVFAFFFFTFFLVCQVLASIFTVLAHKRSLAHYLIPRLILCAGLFICSTIAFIVMLIYFMGGEHKMNEAVFKLHDV
ncbi:unnamed protein product, partial [Mesorhabditis belari]|uniref:Uncharacterized protein n=1 Tax=Mesorhabditis belari TaxID=2138241 RepID=A0AAF3EC38_9BILA